MTVILAIDPGPTESAWVLYDTHIQAMIRWGKDPNWMRTGLIGWGKDPNWMLTGLIGSGFHERVAIEMIASFGMPVGAEVFQTCLLIGRLAQEWQFHCPDANPNCEEPDFITRVEVKKHLCYRTAGVNDAVIRQALIDRFGPGKDKAIGRKATPGPLYGLSGDGWAALAVAVTMADRLALTQQETA